jgi:hypothetical protein
MKLKVRPAEMERFMRAHPFATVTIAGALGMALGGVLLTRMGRFLFAAIAGYVANELWNREARLDVDKLLARLSQEREQREHA